MSTDELVLVIKTAKFKEICGFQGFSLEARKHLATLLAPEHVGLMSKADTEHDPDHKQLIPYCIIRCGNLFFTYNRAAKGGEERLASLVSVGVGGHISEVDVEAAKVAGYKPPRVLDYHTEDIRAALGESHPYLLGKERELHEEVNLQELPTADQLIGLVNDDSTDVGRAHLGVVHLIDIAQAAVSLRVGENMTGGMFRDLAEIRSLRANLEPWSQMCVDAMDQIIAAAEEYRI